MSSTAGGSLDAKTIFNVSEFTKASAQFENVALITESGAGDIYMLGTENLGLAVTSNG